MPEGDRYVTDGALLRCDKGVLVTPLTVLPRPSRVNGRFQANALDCLPLVNVKPFGACAITHGPCMPPLLFWTGAHPGGRTIGPGPAAPLLESSVCQCGLGGRIGITVLPVPGMPALGSGGAGLEAEGAALGRQEAARQQAADDEAHALSGELKEAAGGLAVFGLVCLAVGLVFPPAAVVGAVALELSEGALVAGVAVDVAVAIDHPTQDNWVTVGGDALAIATGYVVGKVIIGPALGALSEKLAQRAAQKAAAEAEAALAAEAKQAAEAAAKAKADKIAANKAKQASPEAQAEKAAREAKKQRGAEKKRLQNEQEAQADAAKRQVPVEPSRTQPSRASNPEAKPGGRRTKVEGDAETQQSLRRENEAADHAAKAGYEVEQNPNVPGSANPDYRLEGKVFDCYSPQGDNLTTISKTMSKKVADEQTRRLLINLDDASGVSVKDISTLAQKVKTEYAPNLEEVLVWKDGQFQHVFP